MSARGKSEVSVNVSPVAAGYTNERVIEFSSPVGGGLISFTVTPGDQLSVHVYRQDMAVQVTAGGEDQPVRHGNMRADAALYRAAKAFVTDWESRQAAADMARPPGPCPNCHGEREWSGRPGIASCHFCGQER